MYGKLGWGFVRRSDLCFNVRIWDNKVRAIDQRKRRKYLKLMIWNKYFHFRKSILICHKMNSPKDMDGPFWGKDLEDVFDWVKNFKWQHKFENMMKRNYLKFPSSTYVIKQIIGIED